MAAKKKHWRRFRHRVMRFLGLIVLYPYSKLKYGVKVDRCPEEKRRPYLILYNHQTPGDQFFIGMAFRDPVYYMATEDIFSLGWISKLLSWAVAPIPILKQTTDVSAIMNCFRIAREGGTIAVAPEGNRTYSGKTEYMRSSIAALAKKLKLPIALFRIEGGYGVEPRWSDKTRKGKIHAYIGRIIEPEEYAAMTNEELFKEIRDGLTVNEGKADGLFLSNQRAEYLERAVYVCPFCGLSEFVSGGNYVTCKHCGKQIEYGADKSLSGVGFDFPFHFMTEWYDYQADYIRNLDTSRLTDKPVYMDEVSLREVIVYHRKELLRKSTELRLYGNRVSFDEGKPNEMVFPFNEVTAASVLGRNKMNLYTDSKVYQIKGSKRFNALKYVHFYYRYRQIFRGDENGEFLGL